MHARAKAPVGNREGCLCVGDSAMLCSSGSSSSCLCGVSASAVCVWASQRSMYGWNLQQCMIMLPATRELGKLLLYHSMFLLQGNNPRRCSDGSDTQPAGTGIQ